MNVSTFVVMSSKYLFTSQRLGFRNWHQSDVPKMYEISADPEVMRYFPKVQSLEYTQNFIQRMQNHFDTHGFCYFAVEILETNEFIGFIGMSWQTYKADHNPSVDIGWRLHKNSWHNGYASEGARACLDYGFTQLKLESIVSVAPKTNIPSIAVMKKIGMHKVKEFEHPLLKEYPELQTCVLYEIKN